jgi:hypothetical protein
MSRDNLRCRWIAVLLLLLAAATPARAARTTFWVSPDGDDAARGSRQHPFRTLERARAAARAVRAAGDVVITLRGGMHRLQRPLELDARDSGAPGHALIFRAARGEEPIVAGSVRVTGWEPAGANVYKAFVGTAATTRQLYVNGRRATRAQTPPYPKDFTRIAEGFEATPGSPEPVWQNPGDVEAVTVTQWKMMRCPVASLDGPRVLMQEPCWSNANSFQAPPGQEPLWDFRLLTRFENARELLDEPGEWFLDRAGWLHYIPRDGEDLATAEVELPVLEVLVDGRGTRGMPVERMRFEGLTFAYATWLGPSSDDGYAADQSGFHLTGTGHPPNVVGHARHVTRTPGNVRFRYARRIAFVGNRFVHLGGVALDFDTGAQRNRIVGNVFEDVSSAAIQVGGVSDVDHHPTDRADVTRDNRITDNLVQHVAVEYVDAAGIYVGFATRTLIRFNDISDVPWSGIALGWGWGLYDPGSFPGLPNATSGEWGMWDTPTPSRGNRVMNNRIRRFLMELWDGGAIYTQGRQGVSWRDAERIAWNVASEKRPGAGGNTFYTDGGSRYVRLHGNVSFDNPQGVTDYGPCDTPTALPLCWVVIPYGTDRGGCIPYGDIEYTSNYWQTEEYGFYDVCWRPPYPINLDDHESKVIAGPDEAPVRILRAAGRRPRWRR